MPVEPGSNRLTAAGEGTNAGHNYLVGGGIASMAAAAFMIRDGDIPGETITIIEELATVGGSLDAAGSAQASR